MEWSNDPELLEMFAAEVGDRSKRLGEGARAMRSGVFSPETVGEMVREGHTIKGTGRVMGFTSIAAAGEMSELVWRWLQQGRVEPSPELGAALEGVAVALPAAAADPDLLKDPMNEVHAVLQQVDLPEPLPSVEEAPVVDAEEATRMPESATPLDPSGDDGRVISFTAEAAAEPRTAPGPEPGSQVAVAADDKVVEPSMGALIFEAEMQPPPPAPSPAAASPTVDSEPASTAPAPAPSYDLGGLVGALETWAVEESIAVGAGNLYRLINDVAALRIDLGAVADNVEAFAAEVEKGKKVGGEEITAFEAAISGARRAASDVEAAALALASAPIADVTGTLPQLVGYLGRKMGKDIAVEVIGDDVMVDRQVLEQVGDAVRQLVVNAVGHGIEDPHARAAAGKPHAGRIDIEATSKDGQLTVVVADDGGGVDWDRVHRAAVGGGFLPTGSQPRREELLALLYVPAFTTVDVPSEIAGDGEGLPKVKSAVESLHGTFTFEEKPGGGTTVTLTVPTRRALQHALIVHSGGQTWGIPEAAIVDVVWLDGSPDIAGEDPATLAWRDEEIPLAPFADLVGLDASAPPSAAVVISTPLGTIALTVESVRGAREVAAKELGPLLAGPATVTGAALLGGDEVVLLVDAGRLAEHLHGTGAIASQSSGRVLVVDDSRGVQQVVSASLASSGFSTITAGSVGEALALLSEHEVDALVVDFSMPRADGVALVHIVRQRYGVLPIVMLSGVAADEDVERAEQAGVDAFFDKSDFREGGLAEKLHELIA